MNSRERSPEEIGVEERLTARFAVLWSEYRRLTEERNALESSTAWALALRLAKWGRLLAPEGSRRQAWLRLLVRGFRLRRRQGAKLQIRSASEIPNVSAVAVRDSIALEPSEHREKIRIAYIGSRYSFDAGTMRYRAHNLVEALTLAGLECTFVAQDEVREQLPTILAHDLIVLVRRIRDDTITTLIGLARRRGLPIVFDIDDYIFDSWIMPYVEAFHDPAGRARNLRLMDELGACLEQCDYFTGSTSYLAEKAAALGKESFVIHNGLNTTQMLQSQSAREQRESRCQGARIGYFSGTRTHQADFRVVYPAMLRVLREERDARLVIVGQLDLGAFPGLAPFMDQIDILPICHWSELPAVIAGVDVNVIPLEATPFNEGKSNLKYYEAGLVEVPSIASPTRILREGITHGHNGLLAENTEEWYNGLKELLARPDWRRQMGRNAYEHVMQNYTPSAIAAEAIAVYRQILRHYRARRNILKQTLNIVVLVGDPLGTWEETLRRANELAAADHTVTVQLAPNEADLKASIARVFLEPLFDLQCGGAIPRCDVLIAVDPHARDLAKTHRHLARLSIADEDRLAALLAAGRGLEPLLRDWVQNAPAAPPPSQAA